MGRGLPARKDLRIFAEVIMKSEVESSVPSPSRTSEGSLPVLSISAASLTDTEISSLTSTLGGGLEYLVAAGPRGSLGRMLTGSFPVLEIDERHLTIT